MSEFRPLSPIARPVHRDSTLVLILGITSVLMCGLFTGIPGIVVGAKGLREVRESQGALDPGALKPGLVLSIIGTVVTVLAIVLVIVLAVLLVLLHDHLHFEQHGGYSGVST